MNKKESPFVWNTKDAKDGEDGSFKYSVLPNATVKLTKYDGGDSYIRVPETIGGKKVSVIGAAAFSMNSNIKTITLPDSVSEIEGGSFAECSSLLRINIPTKVKKIAAGTFKNCNALTEVILENDDTEISELAFTGCDWSYPPIVKSSEKA